MPCVEVQRHRRRIPASLLLLAFALGVASHAAAQKASPELAGDVPEPSECHVAPRSAAEVRALIGTPASDEPGRDVPIPTAVPSGTPVDPATRAEIVDAVREFVACVNTGEPLRYFALVSDGFLVALGPQEEENFEGLEAAGTPAPEDERANLLGVWNVQALADGRVAAAVTIGNVDDPHPAPGRTTVWIFVRGDDRWLLDERIERVLVNGELTYVADVVGTPPSGATPTP